nr:2OG-Fe(II) oxygenase [Microvirga brassicacearum]
MTVDEVDLRGRFKALIDELEGPQLTEALSQRFGQDLHKFPRLTTIMKRSQPKYGNIHTDGPSKVMTLLVYMNDEWEQDEGGRLRVLYNGKDYEPFALEIPPTMGSMFAFLRSDNSWHGHLPFAGERRVVQIAWVKSQADLDRKKKTTRWRSFSRAYSGAEEELGGTLAGLRLKSYLPATVERYLMLVGSGEQETLRQSPMPLNQEIPEAASGTAMLDSGPPDYVIFRQAHARGELPARAVYPAFDGSDRAVHSDRSVLIGQALDCDSDENVPLFLRQSFERREQFLVSQLVVLVGRKCQPFGIRTIHVLDLSFAAANLREESVFKDREQPCPQAGASLVSLVL